MKWMRRKCRKDALCVVCEAMIYVGQYYWQARENHKMKRHLKGCKVPK
jgi:hypothetical protein